MPDEIDRLPDDFADHVISVVIAIRAGENDYAEFHFAYSFWLKVRTNVYVYYIICRMSRLGGRWNKPFTI
jgi:hypothetical protein